MSKEHQHYDAVIHGRMNYYGCTVNTIKDIIANAMWSAKEDMKCDVFTIPMLGTTNPIILGQLGVVQGDHLTFHHFFNWSTGEMAVGQVNCNLLPTIL